MTSVTLAEAQANLAALVGQLALGEVIVITENEKPVAQLTPVPLDAQHAVTTSPRLGTLKGLITIIADDDAHLDDCKEYME